MTYTRFATSELEQRSPCFPMQSYMLAPVSSQVWSTLIRYSLWLSRTQRVVFCWRYRVLLLQLPPIAHLSIPVGSLIHLDTACTSEPFGGKASSPPDQHLSTWRRLCAARLSKGACQSLRGRAWCCLYHWARASGWSRANYWKHDARR